MRAAAARGAATGALAPGQLGLVLDAVPWWLPGALIGVGLVLYGTPTLDAMLRGRLPEWDALPTAWRTLLAALFVAGAGLVALTWLGDRTWTYVLFLLGYARAVEGATVVYLLGRIDDAMAHLFGDRGGRGRRGGAGGGSSLRALAEWAVGRLVKRIPLVVVTGLLSAISAALYATVLLGFPGVSPVRKVAFAFTLSTVYLSTVTTAWTLSRLSDAIGPVTFLGLVACIVGGELYNVPSALRVFTEVPAANGPLASTTVLAVGTIGWFVGLVLGAAFFARRIRTR